MRAKLIFIIIFGLSIELSSQSITERSSAINGAGIAIPPIQFVPQVQPFACDAAHEGYVYQSSADHNYYICNGTSWGAIGGGAPSNATYLIQTANGSLSSAQVMASLSTGIVKNTTTTGVQSIAVAGDFPTLNQNTTGTSSNITGILLEANGGTGSNITTGIAGHYLRSNGTHYVDSAVQVGDIPTLNQNTTGSSGSVTKVFTYTAKSANYTAVAFDLVAATANSFTVTLPACSSNTNVLITVVNNGTGTITIGRTGSDTIGLATSQTLNPATANSQGDSMIFHCDGTSNWNII